MSYPGTYRRKFRVGSITSGIASERVAIHNAGLSWQHAFFAEIAAFPCALLAHRYPETPNFGDITRAGIEEDIRLSRIDLLVASTPCQSFSSAGLRGGLADPRGQLTLRFAEICAHARPEWIVWENVPGALSAASSKGARDSGEPFRQLLAALDDVGYDLTWRVLDAQYFGLAQRRKRLFVVGRLGGSRHPGEVLLEPDRVCWDPPARREARTQAPGDAEARARTGGVDVAGDDAGGAVAGHLVVAGALSVHSGGPDDNDARSGHLVAGSLKATMGKSGPGLDGAQVGHLVIPFDPTQITHPENRALCLPGSPSHALAASARAPTIAFNIYPISGQGADLHARETDVANALLVTDLAAMTDRGLRVVPPARLQRGVRRVTPIECERLQGYPDGYTLLPASAYAPKKFVGDEVEEMIAYLGLSAEDADEARRIGATPDGPRYAALGNSIATNVLGWIFRQIERVRNLP